ncbi:MAG TPA: thiamine phosphate synthase [Vicinamibacterales bacterium]|nr:thiamine phosphate synthase [Vicinamibacterales bacterium]
MMCLVTDRHRLADGDIAVDRLVDLVGAAGRAGIDLIQIRERDLDTRALTALVARCVSAVLGTRTRVVVNDRIDVALATGAHGVHLRADSVAAPSARTVVGATAVIGRSIHHLHEATDIAGAGGVDYLIFGTLHETKSKAAGHPVATLDELRATCRAAAGIPVLAIGGMTLERAADAARAGASGIAGIGLFVPPAGVSADTHVEMIASGLRRAFDTCEAVS